MTDSSDVERDRSRSLGAILVMQGRLAPSDVQAILRYSAEHQLRFGDAAQRLNLLTQPEIDGALAQQFNYPVLARGGNRGVSDELLSAYNPQSELVEPLRALRSQLMLRWISPATTVRRVLTVVSADRGDGRSWMTANLGIVLAQAGYRTLIIDTDMRHPRQHQLFNLPNAMGLTALLTGRAGREIVQRLHPQMRLFVLTSGTLPPNPQELLGRPVFNVVLSAFADQYDVVLLDSPALSEAADGQVLASVAGSALVVSRLNHSSISTLQSAVQDFIQAGVNVVGSVVNEC